MNSVRAVLVRTLDRILDGMAALAALLLLFSVGSVSVSVFMRYVMNDPFTWAIEVNEYLLVIITFLVVGWVMRSDKHVRVDIVLDLVPDRVRYVLLLLSSLIGLTVSVVVTVFGAMVAYDLWERGITNPTLLAPLKGPIVMAIPVGCFVLALQLVRWTSRHWKAARHGVEPLGADEYREEAREFEKL